MKFKMTPMKVCALMILGIVTFGFSLSSLDRAVADYERRQKTISCFPKHSPAAPSELLISKITEPIAKEPLARLFQVLFILFIISPPLIVIFLFLIWKELKTRNRMK